jgi:glycosyltransferase involved in cell wall biosynthesis
MNKNKIAFIVATPITANAFMLLHFEYLSRHFEVYLIANFNDNSSINFSSPFVKATKNIPIQRNISIFKDIKALFLLISYLKKEKFDAIHTITPKAALIGILAAKIVGIKVRTHIFTGQIWHTKTGLFKIILKLIDKFIVFCATNILVDGQSQRKFLIQNKIIKPSNSLVLGKGSISGVDTNKFVPNLDTKQKYRDELRLTNEIVFLFLGRLNTDKGILDLAKAFIKLNIDFPEARLVFIGPDEEQMQKKIEILTNNNKAIIFCGSTTKPYEALQLADVFCLPSYREGFGTSVIEASLLEKPIICSDTYGLMETIVEGYTGLRHKVADVASIYEQMEKMMDENLRFQLGQNGRNYVLDNFSAEKIATEWLNYYQNIL